MQFVLDFRENKIFSCDVWNSDSHRFVFVVCFNFITYIIVGIIDYHMEIPIEYNSFGHF